MTNFKPSELPVATVIEHENEDYIKVNNPIYGLVWEPIRCVDCQGSMDVMNSQADEHFKDVTVISYPASVVDFLAEAMSWDEGQYTTDFWIDEAIKHVMEEQNDDSR